MTADPSRATGWWLFAGTLLIIAGIADLIYGVAAITNSKYFAENVTLIAADLNVYGWVVLIIGLIQFSAGASLFSGGGWGRFVGIIAAGLNAIAYLLTIPAAPIWSLCIFILSLTILYELAKAPERS